MVTALLEKGWARWPVDPAVTGWTGHVLPIAKACVSDPAEQAEWLQCEGTWFVGVDTLPNTPNGDVSGSGPLTGHAYQAVCDLYGVLPLHRGQISVIYPGYPRPRQGESEGGFRYRLKRDAAHVDGLLAVGSERRRMVRERHAYILGLPLTDCDGSASPLVVWEGSHRIMQAAFAKALSHLPECEWDSVDLTDLYQATRRTVFDTCPRIPLPAKPGEAYVIHRLALHGVAPWAEGAAAPEDGRMIAYFRPELPAGTRDWLAAP